MDTVSNPEPVLVEHDCLTSRPKVEQTNKQHVLSEDQEEPAGSWPEDVEGLDMEGKYFRSQFVDEAWASNEDLEESRPVDFDEVQVSQSFSIFSLDYGQTVILEM